MIYSKLSLRTGGGIVSELQQAEQVKNTATLLIGLGGTGIDCLKEIKKQMRVSIKPDNPGAEVPVYEHIRFLAVDNERIEEDFLKKKKFSSFQVQRSGMALVRKNLWKSIKNWIGWI